MKKIVVSQKFKQPVANITTLYKTNNIVLYIQRDKYVKFFHKAKKECRSSAPVQHIMELLVNYYINNKFTVHRKLVEIEDPTKSVDGKKLTIRERRDKREEKMTRVFFRLTPWENASLRKKLKEENVSINHLMDILIEFYIGKKFKVETQIIRTAPYRTGGPRDLQVFADEEDEKKYLTAYQKRSKGSK